MGLYIEIYAGVGETTGWNWWASPISLRVIAALAIMNVIFSSSSSSLDGN